MSFLVTLTPSSNRKRFSSNIFKEYGSRSTLRPLSAFRPRISYFCAPTLSVVLALKLSVMTPPLKTKQYRRFRRPGACLSILRGRDRGRFPLRRGGADAVGSIPNKEATTPHEGKSARSRRVGKERGVCGVARLVHSTHYGLRRAPCIRSLSLPTRLTRNTQTGAQSKES